MSERAGRLVILLLALFVAGQLAVLFHLWRQSRQATIECRATNAGLPLGPGDARVSIYPSGRPAEIAAEGAIGEPLQVPAGTYDVRVLYTRSRDRQAAWARAVKLSPGQRVIEQLSFTAGELSVDVTDRGPPGETVQVIAYVFHPDDHDAILASMGPAERVLLAAASYDVRVVLTVDSEEKGVVWLSDVPVQAGLHTNRTVAFGRGALRVRAYNAGKEIPSPAVTVTVMLAGDDQEEEIERSMAGVSIGLPARRYDVEVAFTGSHDEPRRWLRGLVIRENETREEKVDFSSGTIRVDARLPGGARVGRFDAYIYYYRAGDHREPVVYAPAGEPVILSSGRYDLRANLFRSHDRPDVWKRDLQVEAGETVVEEVTFPVGRLIVRAYDARGEELVGDDVFVYVHAAGETSRPLVTARAGEEIVLTAGVYDLRAEDTRAAQAEVWLRGVRLPLGERLERSVRFR